MPDHTYNVLFLCTGNSARSILAEAILNRIGSGKFTAFSAGSAPKGAVHPQALALLGRLGFPTEGLRSKSWEEFSGGPKLDFVFTVCDNAAGEDCPAWPGQPMTAHWGIPDPAAVEGPERKIEMAFSTAFTQMQNRIGVFLALPLKKIAVFSLNTALNEIGQMDGATGQQKSAS